MREVVLKTLRNDKTNGRGQAMATVRNRVRWIVPFEFTVAAEVWTGELAKGSAALASNASSSDDMPFSRLGSSALLVLHDTLSAPPSYFSDDKGKQGSGAKGTDWT